MAAAYVVMVTRMVQLNSDAAPIKKTLLFW